MSLRKSLYNGVIYFDLGTANPIEVLLMSSSEIALLIFLLSHDEAKMVSLLFIGENFLISSPRSSLYKFLIFIAFSRFSFAYA